MDRTKLLMGPGGERGGDCRNRMGMHPMNRSSGINNLTKREIYQTFYWQIMWFQAPFRSVLRRSKMQLPESKVRRVWSVALLVRLLRRSLHLWATS